MEVDIVLGMILPNWFIPKQKENSPPYTPDQVVGVLR